MDVPAGGRAQALGQAILDAAGRWAAELETLTERQWALPGVNAPEHRLGEDENRPVGVIAHHVATGLALHAEMVRQLARGEPVWLPDLDIDALAAYNARHAAENPHPDRAATVDLIRRRASELADAVRGLGDESLDREGDAYGFHLTVEEFVNRIAIGHGDWHLSSIRATVER
jgi:hypothetical protein